MRPQHTVWYTVSGCHLLSTRKTPGSPQSSTRDLAAPPELGNFRIGDSAKASRKRHSVTGCCGGEGCQ